MKLLAVLLCAMCVVAWQPPRSYHVVVTDWRDGTFVSTASVDYPARFATTSGTTSGTFCNITGEGKVLFHWKRNVSQHRSPGYCSCCLMFLCYLMFLCCVCLSIFLSFIVSVVVVLHCRTLRSTLSEHLWMDKWSDAIETPFRSPHAWKMQCTFQCSLGCNLVVFNSSTRNHVCKYECVCVC